MKFFFITLFLTLSLFAQGFSTRYDVDVGLLGNIGYIDFTLEENGDKYEAKITAVTVGLAATLTGKRAEAFVSSGKIINKKYVPDSFIKAKETTRRKEHSTYFFDHDKREIRLVEEKTKLVNKTKFDAASFEFIKEEVTEISKEDKSVDIYIIDDVISSFLNTKDNCKGDQKLYNLMAIGAHNDENNITLSCIEGLEKAAVISNFSVEAQRVYNLHVAPFDIKESIVDILIAIDEDGLIKEAILGEIFWIGKVTAKRVSHKIIK